MERDRFLENLQDTTSETEENEIDKTNQNSTLSIPTLLNKYKSISKDVQDINKELEDKKIKAEEIKSSVLKEVDELYKFEGLPDVEFLEKYLEYGEKIKSTITEEEKLENEINSIKLKRDEHFKNCNNIAKELRIIKNKIINETKTNIK